MNLVKFQKELVALNAVETTAKMHFEKYGKRLNFLQYLYLRHFPVGSNIEALYTDAAIAQQQRIYDRFREENQSPILQPQNFFPDGKNLEIEKLLRYVDIPPHQHDFIEFAYVFAGRCVHNINGEDYLQEAGSFVAIPYGFAHALFPEEDCLCLTVKMKGEAFLKMRFPGMPNFIYPQAFPCGEDDFVKHCFARIWEQQENDLPYCDQIEEQLFQVLMLYIEQQFHEDVQYLLSGVKQDQQMIEILSYMMDNYQTVTLQSVAAHFHYNPSYFSRQFRIRAGVPFSAVIKEFRLRQAARLLLETGRKLNDICDEVGYKDTTQFIRSFKELFGVTPIQYRKMAQ